MVSVRTIGRTLCWPAGCPQPPAGEDPDKFARKWIKENPNVGFARTSSRGAYLGAGVTAAGLAAAVIGYFKDSHLLKTVGWCLGLFGVFGTVVGKMCGYEFNIPNAITTNIVTGGTDKPQKTPADVGIEADRVETVDITSHGEKLDGYLIKAKTTTDKTLIYLHGVGNNVGDCLEEIKKIQENLNVNVLIVDPRGFGKSKLNGSPLTAEGLVEDAQEMYNYVASRYGSKNISIFGHSLGGAIATRLAENEIDTLILQSTFTRSETAAASFVNGILPIPKFITDLIASYGVPQFNSIDSIGNVKAKKVVVLHGTGDDTINQAQGEALYKALPARFAEDIDKKHIELPGANHGNYNDFYEANDVYKTLKDFICEENKPGIVPFPTPPARKKVA